MGFDELVKSLKDFVEETDAIEMAAIVDRDGLVLHAETREGADASLIPGFSSTVSSLFSDAVSRLAEPISRIDFRTPKNEVLIGIDYGEGLVLCVKVTDRKSFALVGYLAENYKNRITKIIKEF